MQSVIIKANRKTTETCHWCQSMRATTTPSSHVALCCPSATRARSPAACDYPASLTEKAPLHKDALDAMWDLSIELRFALSTCTDAARKSRFNPRHGKSQEELCVHLRYSVECACNAEQRTHPWFRVRHLAVCEAAVH